MNDIQIDVTVRLPLREVERLPKPQLQALMWGVAQVVAALPKASLTPPSAEERT